MSNKILARGIASQILAAIYTLKDCIDRCPEAEWNETHSDYPFPQIVFHILFDCDLKMSSSISELKAQQFHEIYREVFADYEELGENERTHLYTRSFINDYYQFCINKIIIVVLITIFSSFLVIRNF